MSTKRDHQELVVITKTYDLILWSCHHTGRLPCNHRFVLGERIERNLYDLLETLILADYAAGNIQVLADLLMNADEKQFAVIYPLLKELGKKDIPLLTSEI